MESIYYPGKELSLNFVNNEDQNNDRFFKIRPVLESVRKNVLAIEHEKRFSGHEMMILSKGKKAGSRRQYMKNKPTKWGFKFFTRSGVSGIIYDFFVYAGDGTFDAVDFSGQENTFGISGKTVIALCKSIPNPACSVVYCDSFFSSFEMMMLLRENYGIFSLGTMRANKLRGCDFKSDKDLQREGRGSFDQKTDNDQKVVAVK